jgi:hypothetical protein
MARAASDRLRLRLLLPRSVSLSPASGGSGRRRRTARLGGRGFSRGRSRGRSRRGRKPRSPPRPTPAKAFPEPRCRSAIYARHVLDQTGSDALKRVERDLMRARRALTGAPRSRTNADLQGGSNPARPTRESWLTEQELMRLQVKKMARLPCVRSEE